MRHRLPYHNKKKFSAALVIVFEIFIVFAETIFELKFSAVVVLVFRLKVSFPIHVLMNQKAPIIQNENSQI